MLSVENIYYEEMMNVTVIFSDLARIILEPLYSQAADSQVQKHPLKVFKFLVISLVDTHEWMNEIPTVPIHFLATVHHSGWGKYREFNIVFFICQRTIIDSDFFLFICLREFVKRCSG